MSCQDPNTFSLEGIPNVAVEVVISREQKPPRNGKGNRSRKRKGGGGVGSCSTEIEVKEGGGRIRDSAEDIVVGVLIQFSISPQIKKTA